MSDVIIRPLDIDRDADSLAAMWNASDLAWPMSWTRGIEWTDRQVRTWYTEDHDMVIFVAEIDGQIVGYCSFGEGHGALKGEGYLPVLNVHPGYHGRSIGRRLLQATIQRSVEMGWPRQTLGTWSANFKAVPTYKKTGHFWTPGSMVWMQNFIPGALQMPLARPFFDRHDWYSSYVRELDQIEDEQTWEGVPVFTQHWEADGEALTIWIDRDSRAPLAVETDALQVAALPADHKPLAGGETVMRWRVVNKGDEPLAVHLHALGEPGLEIDCRAVFEVPPHHTVVHEAPVRVAADARMKEENVAPAVRSVLRLGDQEVELFPGLCPRVPVTLTVVPAAVTLTPGVPCSFQIQLQSELRRPLQARLRLTPPDGVTLSALQYGGVLAPKGDAAITVTATCDAEGIYDLPIRLTEPEAEGSEALDQSVALYSVGAGGLLARREGDEIRLESDAFQAQVAAREGTVTLTRRGEHKPLLSLSPRVGAPFYPSAFERRDFDLSLAMSGPRAVVHMVAEAADAPGLYLHGELSFSANGLSDLAYWLENRSDVPCERTVRAAMRRDTEGDMVVLPLELGLVRAPISEFPVGRSDGSYTAGDFAEPWFGCQWERGSMGVAWGATTRSVRFDYHITLDGPAAELAPGGRSEPLRVAVLGGDGDWRPLRAALLRWAGRPVGAAPVERPKQWVSLGSAVSRTLDDTLTLPLTASSASLQPQRGGAEIVCDDGLTVEPGEIVVKDLIRGRSVTQPVTLLLPAGRPGVWHGQARLDLSSVSTATPFTVVRPGVAGPVAVAPGRMADQEIWTIDNGAWRWTVAPDFGPSVVAWAPARTSGRDADEENVLWCPFPEHGALSWNYPWFGGVHARFNPRERWGGIGCLHREAFAAAPITVPDAAGLNWQGLRLTADVALHDLRGLHVEIDYLTVAGSDVLRLIYRLHNGRSVDLALWAAVSVSARLGGDPLRLTLRGEHTTRRPMPWGTTIGGQRWGALTDEADGRTLMMVGCQPDVLLDDRGTAGRILGAGAEARLTADGSLTREYYLAVAPTFEDAAKWRVLAADPEAAE